ncbi:Mu-like prophage FluMu protein gp29, partial [Xenorhabdus sp. GDc328]
HHLRPHYWFRTLPEQRDEIRLRDNNGLYGSPLWPFGWLVHRHNARSGFIATSGIYRVLVWPYLFKNFSLRDLAEFLEIYGLPARIATYAAGTSDADRDRLLDSLVRLGHEAVAAIPAGSEIRFESAASGGSEPFMAMINWAERTQSKIILGGTLTTQADGKSSTHALGNVHNEVRHDLMTADARQLEGMFKNLIQMLLALNGHTEINPHRLPRFVFDTREAVDLP